jgi:hypothetical protein
MRFLQDNCPTGCQGTFEYYWAMGIVFCGVREDGAIRSQIVTYIDKNPPDFCPFILEHTLAAGIMPAKKRVRHVKQSRL